MKKFLATAVLAASALLSTTAHAGLSWNGVQLNGIKINGIAWNGVQLNGYVWNGIKLNGTRSTNLSAGQPVAVTLPAAQ